MNDMPLQAIWEWPIQLFSVTVSAHGVSASKAENCTLSKTGDRADALIWLHKWIEEKDFEVQKYPSLRDPLW